MLCLSNGNAEGIGRTREKELELSCKKLGFVEAPTVIDDPEQAKKLEDREPTVEEYGTFIRGTITNKF